jgi:hypothetical protein
MKKGNKHHQWSRPSDDGFEALQRPPSGGDVGTAMAENDGIVGVWPPDIHPNGTDLRPYKRLAAAVIGQALRDAEHAGSDEARRWLSEDSYTLRFWCQWLGINPHRIRGTGKKVHRGRRERGTLRAWRS